jgi:hypothetical protein
LRHLTVQSEEALLTNALQCLPTRMSHVKAKSAIASRP